MQDVPADIAGRVWDHPGSRKKTEFRAAWSQSVLERPCTYIQAIELREESTFTLSACKVKVLREILSDVHSAIRSVIDYAHGK